MPIDSSIFKAYDIRGVYPTQINEEITPQIVRAIYAVLCEKVHKTQLTLFIGQDVRLSSPTLTKITIETLMDLGANILDGGIMSTPSFYFGVAQNTVDGGLQITASHNPGQFNGIKIALKDEKGLIKIGKTTGMEDIKKLATSDALAGKGEKGTMQTIPDYSAQEVGFAMSLLDNPPIAPFTVVADPANAVGGLYIEALFKKIPGNLIKMNFELDGTFPNHQADPLQKETLVDLQKRVLAEHADVGLAPDGDGDRLFFIDEKGEIISPSVITALVARELLAQHPGEKILFDIRYILTPKAVVIENGGTYDITRVGHAFITEKMRDTGAIFAGESSAHFFFKAAGNAEFQLPILITVFAVMTREKKPLSEIVKELKRSEESGEINFTVNNAPAIIDALKKTYADGELDTLDGMAISYPNWRFSVRTSNTEPLLRLNVEALTKEDMEKQRDKLVHYIEEQAKQ